MPQNLKTPATFFVSENQQIGVTAFKATQYQAEVVLHAMQCFGYLIKSVALLKTTFNAFADLIETHYDTSNPQTHETVNVLRQVATLNP